MRSAGKRLRTIFSDASERNCGVLVAYVTCGDPSLEATRNAVDILMDSNIDIIELGVPFSDPVADGPTIQAASERALLNGVCLDDVFEMARYIRSKNEDIGIVLMGYANPFYYCGLEKTAIASGKSGVDGWIVPDVPFEESCRFTQQLDGAGVALVPLLAPTTSLERAIHIAEQSDAPFIYYVSVTGVTGERSEYEAGWQQPIDTLRGQISTPVVVGFGISSGQAASDVIRHADGVVVGSAIVRRIATGDVEEISAFAQELRDAI